MSIDIWDNEYRLYRRERLRDKTNNHPTAAEVALSQAKFLAAGARRNLWTTWALLGISVAGWTTVIVWTLVRK